MIGEQFDEVLAGAQAGDEWAIGVLWRDLHPVLLRYLRSLEPGSADDVESETWLQAARDLRGFEGGEPAFRGWMFTIARHRLSDWRRKAARRPSIPVAPADLPVVTSPDDPETAAIDQLGTDAAVTLVASLPEAQAEVVLLRVLGGLDVDQVAAIVGKRPGAVRVLQHRGLRRLAAIVEEVRSPQGGVTQ
jgi:RNA polymerase sigma-70 factor (ECF subfamily)